MSALAARLAAASGLRTRLRRHPVYTVAMIVGVGVGLAGINAASRVLDALVLRTIPGIAAPRELVRVYVDHTFSHAPRASMGRLSFPVYRGVVNATRGLGTFSAKWSRAASLREGVGVRPVNVTFVTPNYLEMLGVPMLRGSGFDHTAEVGAARIAVVSASTYAVLRGSGTSDVGGVINVDGVDLTVIGVTTPGFRSSGSLGLDIFVPIGAVSLFGQEPTILDDYSAKWVEVIGRLPAKIDRDSVARHMETELRRSGDLESSAQRNVLQLAPLQSALGPERSLAETVAWLLAILAVFILAATLLNTLTMSAARWAGALPSWGIRSALGGTRRDILAMIGAEAAFLALVGALLGLGLSAIVEPFLQQLVSEPSSVLHPRVLLITGGCMSLYLPAALGCVWVLRTARLGDLLKSGAPQLAPSFKVPHRLFLSLQVSLAFCLIVAGSALQRNFRELANVDLGFAPDGLYVLSLTSGTLSARPDAIRELYRTTSASPFVSDVSISGAYPFGNRHMLPLSAETGSQIMAVENVVESRFFETMGIPIVAGRTFAADHAAGASEVIVSKGLADMLLPGSDPLNRCLFMASRRCSRVVGIAADVRQAALSSPPEPTIYRVLRPAMLAGSEFVIARARSAEAADALVRHVRAGTGELGMINVQAIDALMQPMLEPWRTAALMVSILAFACVLLVCLGTFALARLMAMERMRENAVRLLLGAHPMRIKARIVGGGLVGCAAGIAIGAMILSAVAHVQSGVIPFANDVYLLDYIASTGILVLAVVVALLGPARIAGTASPKHLW